MLHTWSLGVEEQFYFVWPILLVLCFKFFKKGIIPLIAIIFIVSLGLNIYYININTDAMYYLPWFRAYEIILGALLVKIMDYRLKSKLINEVIILLGMIVVGLSAFYFTKRTASSFVYSFNPCDWCYDDYICRRGY